MASLALLECFRAFQMVNKGKSISCYQLSVYFSALNYAASHVRFSCLKNVYRHYSLTSRPKAMGRWKITTFLKMCGENYLNYITFLWLAFPPTHFVINKLPVNCIKRGSM